MLPAQSSIFIKKKKRKKVSAVALSCFFFICYDRCFREGNTYTSDNVTHNTINRLLTNCSSQVALCLCPAQTCLFQLLIAHCMDSLMCAVGFWGVVVSEEGQKSQDVFIV